LRSRTEVQMPDRDYNIMSCNRHYIAFGGCTAAIPDWPIAGMVSEMLPKRAACCHRRRQAALSVQAGRTVVLQHHRIKPRKPGRSR
jgi:hypothetical protein